MLSRIRQQQTQQQQQQQIQNQLHQPHMEGVMRYFSMYLLLASPNFAFSAAGAWDCWGGHVSRVDAEQQIDNTQANATLSERCF